MPDSSPRPRAVAAQLAELLGPPCARPASLVHPVPVRRVDDEVPAARPEELRRGPEVLPGGPGDRRRVRFSHRCAEARAVALQANGWWTPEPADACDLRPVGDGWFTGVFEAPADWRATYAFAEHRGQDDPPWWQGGLKATGPAVQLVADAGCARQHRAARGGEVRSMVDLLAPEAWDARAEDAEADDARPEDARPTAPVLHDLPVGPDRPRVRWGVIGAGTDAAADVAASDGPASEGPPADGSSADGPPAEVPSVSRTGLPLLILLDAEAHLDALDTPAVLQRAVACGALPPLMLLALNSGRDRGDVLGVPGGHAPWISEELLPRLRELAPVGVTEDPARTVVSGSSFGGLTSLFALLEAPERIGCAIAQSASLWRYPALALAEPLARLLESHPAVRIRMHAGWYEGDMVARAAELRDAVPCPGEQITLRAVSGGHDWAWWQPELVRELSALLA